MKSEGELIIKAKKRFAEELYRANAGYSSEVPSMKETQRWVRDLINLLFPIKENRQFSLQDYETGLIRLMLRMKELMTPLEKELKSHPDEITSSFFNELPEIFKMLSEDAKTFVKSDPAAEKLEEVILCYPGFFSLIVYRIAHILYKLNVPVIPRIMTEYAHSKTGIDIHPGAVIGKNCFIDHGTGIVIGETTVVGENVKIYQGVTLGALFVKKSMSDTKRHPTIEDNVILYSGCTILGGNTVIGHDTIVGGNVWITESVLPHNVVYRENKTVIRENIKFDEPYNFII
jgi:serine O-acetyltransferase